MKTSYIFNDGTTGGQEKGGFTAAEGAQDINWIICPRTAPIAVSRTDKVRIFDPETYQKKRAWATDYRKYHDLWVPDNKLEAMWVKMCIRDRVMEAAHESKVARIVPAASPKVLELQRPDEEPLLKAVAGGPDLDTMNRNAMKRNGGAEHE